MKLFAGSNFRESNVSGLFFANRSRFAKFAKIRSSRIFSRLQYQVVVFLEYVFYWLDLRVKI
ncbi:MAG: hypothetical protein PV344_06035 [Anaplasma sp.]|nr:hypothetical protein [Anaplasma sp.]